MSSLSESVEHSKIHEAKEKLAQEARFLKKHGISKNTPYSDIKGFSPESFRDVYRLNAVEPSAKVIFHMTEAVVRILIDSPTRGERRKIREMAGVGKLSRSERQEKRKIAGLLYPTLHNEPKRPRFASFPSRPHL